MGIKALTLLCLWRTFLPALFLFAEKDFPPSCCESGIQIIDCWLDGGREGGGRESLTFSWWKDFICRESGTPLRSERLETSWQISTHPHNFPFKIDVNWFSNFHSFPCELWICLRLHGLETSRQISVLLLQFVHKSWHHFSCSVQFSIVVDLLLFSYQPENRATVTTIVKQNSTHNLNFISFFFAEGLEQTNNFGLKMFGMVWETSLISVNLSLYSYQSKL